MKINNSEKMSIDNIKWKNPGASLYNELCEEDNWDELLKEAYIVAPVNNIDVNPDHKTPFTRSGCKYPHHVIKDGKLVLSRSGVRAAYSRMKQMGIYKGEYKDHIDSHLKELGMMDNTGVHYEDTMNDNFNDIQMYIENSLNVSFDDSYLDQALFEASHGKLKYDYRQVKDVNTGHRLLCVYSLKGAQITLPGHAWKGHIPDEKIEEIAKTDPEKAKELREIKARDNKEVQANIRKKGNIDHQSYGQQLLAVKDLETGEQWSAYKHVDTNLRKNLEKSKDFGKEFKIKGYFMNKSNDPIFTIKLGEVESEVNKTFKSTKNFTFKHDKYNMFKLSMNEPVHKFFRGVEKDNVTSAYTTPKLITITSSDVRKIKSGGYRSVFIQNGTKKIGKGAFAYCGFKSITLPEGLEEIGDKAFAYCKPLKSITIPKSVKKIGNDAFRLCGSLTSVTLPEGLEEIGDDAFSWCNSLESINIPNSVKKIGNNTFWGCDSLPDSVKEQIRKINPNAIFESTNIDEGYDLITESMNWIDQFVNNSEFRESISKSYQECRTPEELMNWMSNHISYGWKNLNGKIYYDIDDDNEEEFFTDYRLQSPSELSQSGVGVCWDQCELEREWFTNNNIPNTVFYIALKISDTSVPTHTFLVFKDNDKYYWFEHSWGPFKGIHQFNTLQELHDEVTKQHRKAHNDDESPVFIINLKNTPDYGITCQEFMSWANKQDENEYSEDDMFTENVGALTNIQSPQSLNKWMNNITPSYASKQDNFYHDMNDKSFNPDKHASLQPPKDIARSKKGSVFDKVELERFWFDKHGYRYAVLCVLIENEEHEIIVHPFIVYQQGKYICWFENSLPDVNGSIEFKKLDSLIYSVLKYVSKANNTKSKNAAVYYLDTPPKFGISHNEYIQYVTSQIELPINDLPTKLFNESADSEYDPPLSYDKLPDHLKNDAIHSWRAKTGIELIHKEPSYEEFKRIYHNWLLMSDDMKKISDEKSIELFGVDNLTHYHQLLVEYQDSKSYQINKNDNKYSIVNNDGTIISKMEYYIYDMNNFDWINIVGVDTHPDYQHQGYASLLLNELISDMDTIHPEMGLYLLVRTNNDPAINLYKKAGFSVLKTQKSDNGEFFIMYRGNADTTQLMNCNFNTESTLYESLNLFEEKSHGNLKYCYRVGFDANTGEQIAIEFDLDPNAITQIGDKRLTERIVSKFNMDNDINQIHDDGREELIKNIKKYGCIDFVSKALRVNAIFTKDHKSLQTVKMVPMFSDVFQLAVKFASSTYPEVKSGYITSIEDLIKYPKFKKDLADRIQMHPFDIETYTVGETAGNDKYKMTKLLWDHRVLKSYQLTPILRGYNKIGRINNYNDALNYIAKNINNKFNENSLFEDIIQVHHSWGDPIFILPKQTEFDEEVSFMPVMDNDNHDYTIEEAYFKLLDMKYEQSMYMKESDESTDESMPKQTDKKESDKNGVNRKKLYIAFIEWCKTFNDKNTFGSMFDKDVFHITYPFVPEAMRYFYRLANPLMCILSGKLTFFQLSELRKVNAKNSQLANMMIFAATEKDMRVFNVKDGAVYMATEENGAIKLGVKLADSFDLYIQTMINRGDILNGADPTAAPDAPPEEIEAEDIPAEEEETETPIEEQEIDDNSDESEKETEETNSEEAPPEL